MAWEIEDQYVDKELGMHRFVLVEKTLGARQQFDVVLGTGHDGQSCPHCSAPVRLGWKLGEDGKLVDKDGLEVVPRTVARQRIADLNAFHARMDKHAQRHSVKTRKSG